MIMEIVECGRDCVDVVGRVIKECMSSFHAYYAVACLDAGVCRALVAYEEHVVGVSVFYSVPQLGVGVIYYVVVPSEFRGRGIGMALVASIEEILEEWGSNVFVATTRRSNLASRRMLSNLDYVEVDLEGIYEELKERITMLTCSYDDDLLYLKPREVGLDYLLNKLLERDAVKVIEKLWRMICYEPWRRLKRL